MTVEKMNTKCESDAVLSVNCPKMFAFFIN